MTCLTPESVFCCTQDEVSLALAASAATALCGPIQSFCSGVGLDSELSSDGAIQVLPIAAKGAVLGFAGTPRITMKTIKELTRVSNAFNIITVHIRTNFMIRSTDSERASITITNLLGTQWPREECVDNAINLRPTFMELLPNCSCSACEIIGDCACKDAPSESPFLQNRENFLMWQPEGSNLFGTPKNLLQMSDVQGKWDPRPEVATLELEFFKETLLAGKEQNRACDMSTSQQICALPVCSHQNFPATPVLILRNLNDCCFALIV